LEYLVFVEYAGREFFELAPDPEVAKPWREYER
jgi:hypothetical protein